MTESDELKSIIQALVAKTASGKLSWKLSRKGRADSDQSLPTHDSSGNRSDFGDSVGFGDAYYVRLGSGFVVMKRFTPEYEPDHFSLFFFNNEGNKAAEYKVESGEVLWNDLAEMINDIHKKLFGWKSLVNELVG